jgi:enterobactin synthetase component D
MPQPVRSPALFPPFVAQHSVAFDSDEVALIERFPGVAIPHSLARAVSKRRVEYCAGRYCARQAMHKCAPEHTDVAIPSGPRGEPLWPPGIVGAITHTHGFASVAVARTRDARAIGLDAEHVMAEKQAIDVLEQIATPNEVSTLLRTTRWGTAMVLSVVFSAKETIFKCLYPEVGRYFDFRDAVVDELDPSRGSFSARLVVALTPRLAAGTRLDGRFERNDGWVCTGMTLAPS